MIGIYIVDGILLLGLGYLCCSSHRRSSENLVNEENSLEEWALEIYLKISTHFLSFFSFCLFFLPA